MNIVLLEQKILSIRNDFKAEFNKLKDLNLNIIGGEIDLVIYDNLISEYLNENNLSNQEIHHLLQQLVIDNLTLILDTQKELVESIKNGISVNHVAYEALKLNSSKLVSYLNAEKKKYSTNLSISNNVNVNTKEQIKWNKDIKELAYLFYALKEKNLIHSDTLGKALSEIFINSNDKQIKNNLINKYFDEFRNGKSYPESSRWVDEFIKRFK